MIRCTMPALPTHRLRSLIDNLQAGLLERDTASRLALLAALAGEHVLLIGPPGTAKSELARRLHRAFEGAPYFERLLTRFSTPEELFGPLSLKALEDDRYERLIEGFLPTAGIAFLDEVFKANSAILNALLTLLNEREFDNGSGRLATPLISVVAASNEVPVDEALHAFYDRFLVRIPVQPVSDEAFRALLVLTRHNTGTAPSLTLQERAAVAAIADQLDLSESAIDACARLRRWLQAEKIATSDRRWRQWTRLMKTAAATEGRDEVDSLDLWTAPYIVSPAPEGAPRVAHWFAAEVLQAVPQDAQWLTRAVEAFEKQLEIEEAAPPEGDDTDGAGKLALARAIGRGGEDPGGDAMLRIVSEKLEHSLRRHYSSVHVAARLKQVDDILQPSQQARAAIQAELEQLQDRLAARLWISPSLQRQWVGAHEQTLETLDTLISRLQRCRAGFAALPVQDDLLAEAPVPIELPALA